MMANTSIEIEITKIVNGGYGLGKLNGLVYLVPFAYPGDIVLIEPFSKKKNLVWGQIKEIIKNSPYRETKLCPEMGNCGSCMWGMLNYKKQIECKKQLLEENIKKFLGIEEINLEIIFDEKNKYNYRTRVIYHSDGERLGFYKFRTNQVVDVSKCVITYEEIETIRKKLPQKNTRKDIQITINPYTNEYLLYPSYLYKYIYNNGDCNYKNKNKDYFLFDNIPVVNGCFSQNSLILNKTLKNKVKEFIQGDQKILDLYCGSGNFSIDLDKERYVVGIDVDSTAIQRAREFSNFQYKIGNEKLMSEYIRKENWDTILLDPPRTGAKKLVPCLIEAKTKKIIYISCEPVTMCRDIKELKQKGWEIQKVVGIDMFPHTPHIESIVVLTK